MGSDHYLHIYLNDHLAAALAGRELAARCLSSNRGTHLGAFLETLLPTLDEHRGTLARVMDRVGARSDVAKQVAAWAGEKLGRLKLNGRLIGYSDLSRVVELEGLCLGSDGRRALWRTLAGLAPGDERLRGFDFVGLEKVAASQKTALERFRRTAASQAFSP